MIINYFCGSNALKLHVPSQTAIVIQEFLRMEWREIKRIQVHEISLDKLKEDGFEPADSSMPDPLTEIIDETERKEFCSKCRLFFKSLTAEQLWLLEKLYSNFSVTEISKTLGVSKAAISQKRKRIQEKFKKL